MKIKKPKRIMSLFLAALMCVTSLVGMGTTAYAAEETDDVYLISFPRDGDSNYNAEWGHGSHTFMNGWKTGTSRYTTVRAMGSYTGNICYCIEIGVPQQTGDSYTKKGEDFWDNYPSSYNSTISPDDIKLFIGRSSSTAIREQSQPRGVLRTRAAISWLTQSLHSFSFGKPSSASVMKTLTRSAQAARTLLWIRLAAATLFMTRL